MRTPLLLLPLAAAHHDAVVWSRASHYYGGAAGVGFTGGPCLMDSYENVGCVARTLPPVAEGSTLTITLHDAVYPDARYFVQTNVECERATGHEAFEAYGGITIPLAPECDHVWVLLINRATTGDASFVVSLGA